MEECNHGNCQTLQIRTLVFSELAHHWWEVTQFYTNNCLLAGCSFYTFSISFLTPPSFCPMICNTLRIFDQCCTEEAGGGSSPRSLQVQTGQDNTAVGARYQIPTVATFCFPCCLHFWECCACALSVGFSQGVTLSPFLPLHSFLHLNPSRLLPFAATLPLTFWGRSTQNTKVTVLWFENPAPWGIVDGVEVG